MAEELSLEGMERMQTNTKRLEVSHSSLHQMCQHEKEQGKHERIIHYRNIQPIYTIERYKK